MKHVWDERFFPGTVKNIYGPNVILKVMPDKRHGACMAIKNASRQVNVSSEYYSNDNIRLNAEVLKQSQREAAWRALPYMPP